jgi:tetratricopeptide (TPR) repeat protein
MPKYPFLQFRLRQYRSALRKSVLQFRCNVQGRTSESNELFREAVEIDPEYAIAHRELGWALRRLDQYPEAERHIRRAIELDDLDEWVHIYLGNLL